MFRYCTLLMIACALGATEPRTVELAAPLTTVVPVSGDLPSEPATVVVDLAVPEDAPADLGLGAFAADDDGTWYQRFHPEPLAPGRHRLRLALDRDLHAEPGRGHWSPHHRTLAHRAGIFLWSASDSRCPVVVHALRVEPLQPPAALAEPALFDLGWTGVRWVDGQPHIACGRRIELRCRPHPFPADHYDHHGFELGVEVVVGDRRIDLAGFYHQPMELVDQGHRELARPAGPADFRVRYRPVEPGVHRLRLHARWGDGRERRVDLGELVVEGPRHDPIVHVDPVDPRFFATGDDAFVWPIGINARSVNDPRGSKRVGSRLSPDRRWHAYRAYLDRWSAAGMTAAEIWMSSWNLALEWRDDWPGFHGVGSYNQANAARLDRILDHAWSLGIRINLVIHNHGMASAKTDAEWRDNPYNAALRFDGEPGAVGEVHQFFTHPAALAGQERLRRYIIARWGDHPAVLGWKLWTEINLTGGHKADLRQWHLEAARRWHQLDPYRHPVTTHWSGNYRTPDRAIVGLRELDYVCIDAYHGRRKDRRGTLFADLAWDGLHHRWHGLAQFDKPILITEYGGNWDAAPPPQLISEHHHGPWACLVSGYAGSPMLWWMEWVDQGGRFAPYTAIGRFVAGEDLRSRPGSQSRGLELPALGADRTLWCRAWTRPGRILGYLLDPEWGYDGRSAPEIADGEIVIGSQVSAGAMTVEWWDAETGEVVGREPHHHPGGELRLPVPPFQRHVAFKLWREGQE